MTRGRPRKQSAPSKEEPPVAEGSEVPTEASPPPQHKKKVSMADNAKQIQGMKSELSSIALLLKEMRDDKREEAAVKKAVVDSRQKATTRKVGHLELNNDTGDLELSDDDSVVQLDTEAFQRRTNKKARHRSEAANPSPFEVHADSTRRRHPTAGAYDFPDSADELEENEEIKSQVVRMLTANMAPVPSATRGKRYLAHTHIVRGKKKTKATLGELNESEYNWGFLQCIFHPKNSSVEKKLMVKHMEDLNEDAMSYEWDDVREWSEEVCTQIAATDGKLTWANAYKIDRLRLKMSQVSKKGGRSGSDNSKEAYSMSEEMRSAKAAPPCRQFNSGNCQQDQDHTVNGFRHLHVCSFCIFQKCEFLPHPELSCKSKQFKQERKKWYNAREQTTTTKQQPGAGFGQ